jgi:hypothetical protein
VPFNDVPETVSMEDKVLTLIRDNWFMPGKQWHENAGNVFWGSSDPNADSRNIKNHKLLHRSLWGRFLSHSQTTMTKEKRGPTGVGFDLREIHRH